jgi:hypothetical protein
MEVIDSPASDWSLTLKCTCGSTLKLSAPDVEYHSWTEYVCTFESIWGPAHSEYAWQRYHKYRFKCPVCNKKPTIKTTDLPENVKLLARRAA